MSDATFTGASNYNRTVYGTWDLSFKEIEKRTREHSTPKDAQVARAAIMIFKYVLSIIILAFPKIYSDLLLRRL